jgi:aminopeptidase-like protein
MNLSQWHDQLDAPGLSRAMHAFMTELYPLCRSITGDGLRETLRQIQRRIPLQIHEVPTGTPVFDWTIPREWNIRDASICDPSGRRLVDFRASNLHVVNYSVPVRQRMRGAELRPHLHTLPDHPDWIPYRTSYYQEYWGFCLTRSQWEQIDDQTEYDVCIDATLAPGSLSYGECFLAGQRPEEVLISTHACHPSLCNDNLSGIAVATTLAHLLAPLTRRYSYRFLFVPGTIGAITWLSRNESVVPRVRHGLVLTGLGDPGPSTYKRSRQGQAEVDRAVEHVLKHAGGEYRLQDFIPYGYDERQYCSPGFNLPVGCFMRSPHGTYPQYHTSGDNLEFVRLDSLADSLAKLVAVLEVIEGNRVYQNLCPKCEPMLGRRGLYAALGGTTDKRKREMAMLWVLNLADGRHSSLDIAERAGLPFRLVQSVAEVLQTHELLREILP